MKLAAAHAIAALARREPSADLKRLYPDEELEFGRDYILPKPFDRRLLQAVAPAVAKAAMDSGVARRNIDDLEKYGLELRRCVVCADAEMENFLNNTCRLS